MARIPYLDPADASQQIGDALKAVPELNIFRMLAHAQSALVPYLGLGAAILSQLELDPQLRELAILQVAKQSEADYEWVQHEAIGRHAGLTEEQIEAVRRGDLGDGCLSEVERAVLGFTTEVVAGPRVGDGVFAGLERWLGPREIVELLMTIGSYLMLARVMTVLELEIDAAAGDAVVDAARTVD